MKVEELKFYSDIRIQSGLSRIKRLSPLHAAAGALIGGSDAGDVSRHCLAQLLDRDVQKVGS
jgi:hypothetical protein